MIRSQLNTYNGGDPIWGFIALVGSERFTGEAAVGLDPRVRLFAVDGRVYFAERDGDAPVGAQLVNRGVLTNEQLERSSVSVNGVTSLARMFHRDPTVDRDAVELSIAAATESLVESIANKAVGMPEVFPLRHHSSGMHHWLHVVNTAPLVLPVAPVEEEIVEEEIVRALAEDDSVTEEPVVEPVVVEPVVVEAVAMEAHVADDPALHEAPVTTQIPIVTFEEVVAWSPVEVFATPTLAAPVEEPVVEAPVAEEPVVEESVVEESVVEATLDVESDTTPVYETPPDLTVLAPWSSALSEPAWATETITETIIEPAAETEVEPVTEQFMAPMIDLDEVPEIEPLTVSIGGLMPLPMLGSLTATEPVEEPNVIEEPNVVEEAEQAHEPAPVAQQAPEIDRQPVALAGLTELLPPAPPMAVAPPLALPTLGSLAGLTALTPTPAPARPETAATTHDATEAATGDARTDEPIVLAAPSPAPELPKLAAAPISMHELVAQQEQAETAEAPTSFGGTTTMAAVDIWEMVDDILDEGDEHEQQLVGSGASEKRGRSWLRSRKG